MNVLFLADPSSIHDLKWMSFFIERENCYLIHRRVHSFDSIKIPAGLKDLGSIPDFSILHPVRSIKSLLKLKKIIQTREIEIFHIQYAEPNVLWAICKFFFNIKIMVTTHGSDILLTIPNHFRDFSPQNLYVRGLYKLAFSKCDIISATSSRQKDKIEELFNPKSIVSIVRIGIDMDELEHAQLELPSSLQKRPYILMPRMMRPVYNHELTIKAIALLPETIITTHDFVFVDSDSRDSKYIEEIKRLMSLQPEVNWIFLPKQNQRHLFALYKQANLVIMNPISDGTPVSALEAMYFESPTIVGPLGYDKDLFGNWVMKLTSWDENELSNLIVYGLTEFDRKKTKIGKEKVLEFGNMKIEMSKAEMLYKSLLSFCIWLHVC